MLVVFGLWSRQFATAQSLRVLASPSRLLPRRGVRLTPKALTLLEHRTASSIVQPNVRGNLPVEAGADWPRKDNLRQRLERPARACLRAQVTSNVRLHGRRSRAVLQQSQRLRREPNTTTRQSRERLASMRKL